MKLERSAGGVYTLRTERLALREWRDSDLPAFAAMNADERVMEHFPATLTRAESDALVARIQRDMSRDGFGLWAAALAEDERLIGFIGLMPVDAVYPCAPAVEIGWRLAHEHWGKGLAHEGATACVELAFGALALPELVAFTYEGNLRSRRLMERLGMSYDETADFMHPHIEPTHRIAPHVLYRLRGAPEAAPAEA